ncbi:Signal transduction histidine kinase [Saccharopolyspora antimicrobica]|uniref:Oxygen sensor histidine kinase NreB n=1 Tax=Saccharopolyspora antimicrobica TaxID=455193 RepID=A0A1I4REL7_9PSEU|nr:signal transduction histidine kinase [Saccharopolyspora antimicrobica]SFM50486.1 Signal transduction histidine kinase [Saccharopolyspora antimicrobica]
MARNVLVSTPPTSRTTAQEEPGTATKVSTVPETSSSPGLVAVLRLVRLAFHAGFLLLLAIATARVWLTHPTGATGWLAAGGAALLTVVYGFGAVLRHALHRRWLAMSWLAAVTAVWAALLAISPDFSWLAFPLFFLHLHLLRGLHALIAVVVVTALVVTAQGWRTGAWSVGMVLGPIIGAGVAVIITWGYAAIYAENQRRQALIDDLTRTRAELATTQHQAGVAAERERLAREIHDTLAQGLSSIILLLRAAETALPPEADKARARITEAHRTAADNLDEARRFVRDLRPPSLSDAGLPQALDRLCQNTARETGTDCRLLTNGAPVALPSSYEVALLRAAQTSLSNVTRHAAATTAVVTLGYLDTEVTLDIYDDGTGFDPTTVRPAPDGTGYGLTGLRERITALGGSMAVESAPGDGTAVAIRLPLTPEEIR